jgi:hypothetical protein
MEVRSGATRLPYHRVKHAWWINNYAEDFFADLKHDKRRRSDRKVLTQDFEFLPPEAALARNFWREDYMKIVWGSIDQLHKNFSRLDALA